MQAVVDTNVWVSALLTPGGTASQVLQAFRKGKLTPLYSREIEAEYLAVLARPKFQFPPELVAEFLDRLHADARLESPSAINLPPLPDPNDAPFIALALFTRCPIITGNLRHFPPELGVTVMTPGEWVERGMV
jgi:putative PIN family toxin of toxin-antitoxin system